MKNGDKEAFAIQTNDSDTGAYGLSKREYMATQILAGLLSEKQWFVELKPGVAVHDMVEGAINFTEELLKQLGEKT